MTTVFRTPNDPIAARYWADLESALMARAIAANSNLPPERQKALRRLWALGSYNAAAYGLEQGFAGHGDLVWTPEGDGYRLTYHAPYGLVCPLARIYRQDDETWAALIVAGVRDNPAAAMEAAAWGVSRLTAE